MQTASLLLPNYDRIITYTVIKRTAFVFTMSILTYSIVAIGPSSCYKHFWNKIHYWADAEWNTQQACIFEARELKPRMIFDNYEWVVKEQCLDGKLFFRIFIPIPASCLFPDCFCILAIWRDFFPNMWTSPSLISWAKEKVKKYLTYDSEQIACLLFGSQHSL